MADESDRQGKKRFRIPTLGIVLAPVLAACAYWLLGGQMGEPARRTAAIAVFMAVFWITEAIPLPATSLLPLVLFPLLGVVDIADAAQPFAKPVIFLFLGGFLLAMAVEQCNLHRRVALSIVRWVGPAPGRLLAGFMAATALLSMWISNTATTVMMIPIALSLVELAPASTDADRASSRERLQLCLLLGIAYAANIGGLGTLVGTPPNAFLAGFLHDRGVELGFGRWMLFAVPLVVVFLTIAWWLLLRLTLRGEAGGESLNAATIDDQLSRLGSITRAEWTVLTVFLVTVSLWIFREPLAAWPWLTQRLPWVTALTDASIAIGAAIVLFLAPVNQQGERALTWKKAETIPWGVLILFGGGLSLANAMKATELDGWLADRMGLLQGLPPLVLVAAITVIVIFLTEVASNTALIAALLPVLYGFGLKLEEGPLLLAVPATLAASCAFMFPVATPPNAVVYQTGKVPMRAMIRCGFWLNLMGAALIPLAVFSIARFLFGE